MTALAVAPPGPDQSTADVQVLRYIVEVEQDVAADRPAFAALINATLNDSRSWAAEGRRFVQVAEEPVDFRVTLATPSTTDERCLPLITGGTLSCWDGERAMLNAVRWYNGAEAYGADIDTYRIYLVNHEVGHGLGRRQENCPRAGALAPVMISDEGHRLLRGEPLAVPLIDQRNGSAAPAVGPLEMPIPLESTCRCPRLSSPRQS